MDKVFNIFSWNPENVKLAHLKNNLKQTAAWNSKLLCMNIKQNHVLK